MGKTSRNTFNNKKRDGGVTQKQLATNNQTNKNKQYARKKTQI